MTTSMTPTRLRELLTMAGLPAADIDASVAALAKRHDTPHGQQALQHLHDVAVSHGAVCSASNARMASRHEANGIQAVHDTAVEHGASCAAAYGRTTVPTSEIGPILYSAAAQRALLAAQPDPARTPTPDGAPIHPARAAYLRRLAGQEG